MKQQQTGYHHAPLCCLDHLNPGPLYEEERLTEDNIILVAKVMALIGKIITQCCARQNSKVLSFEPAPPVMISLHLFQVSLNRGDLCPQ